MSSPTENSSKDKDTNGIQNPEAQSGLQKAGEHKRPLPVAVLSTCASQFYISKNP